MFQNVIVGLLTLFGFSFSDIVQWNEVCESAPVTKHQAETCFSDLADAFITLQQHSKYWTEDDIVSVIDELTGEMTKIFKVNSHLRFFRRELLELHA